MKLFKTKFKSQIQLPGDKSLSHRALIMASMVRGVSVFENLSISKDVESTKKCLQQLGAKIESDCNLTHVFGVGPTGFKKPNAVQENFLRGVLDCGNSGTTMRLLMGVLAAQSFESSLVGDESLSKRPMLRVAEPLRNMGAKIELTNGNFAPVKIYPSTLTDLEYQLPVASAQVKSAILLSAWAAGVSANVKESFNSRDHTERMLPEFTKGPVRWLIPCDISAACNWLAIAILAKKSIRLENVLLNPQRLGFVRKLQEIGIDIKSTVTQKEIELSGFIELSSFLLKPFKISREEVPALIDEIPLLVLLSTQASGVTEISGAEELRYKETDRIEKTRAVLNELGLKVQTKQDGFIIEGPQKIRGSTIDSFGDHRLAMLGMVASFGCDETIEISRAEAVKISDPYFAENLL